MKTRPLPRLGWLAALAALLLLPGRLPAMTVDAPNFQQLVDEADAVFKGEVLSVHSDWSGVGANRHIATYVQFRVIQVFKGSAPNPQILEFAGGTVGDRSLRIPGMPQFQVGQTEFLFVQGNGTTFCPLVGAFHGRVRVERDKTSGQEVVFLHDGTALSSTSQIGKPSEIAAAMTAQAATAMTAAEFGQQIQGRVSQSSGAPATQAH